MAKLEAYGSNDEAINTVLDTFLCHKWRLLTANYKLALPWWYRQRDSPYPERGGRGPASTLDSLLGVLTSTNNYLSTSRWDKPSSVLSTNLHLSLLESCLTVSQLQNTLLLVFRAWFHFVYYYRKKCQTTWLQWGRFLFIFITSVFRIKALVSSSALPGYGTQSTWTPTLLTSKSIQIYIHNNHRLATTMASKLNTKIIL